MEIKREREADLVVDVLLVLVDALLALVDVLLVLVALMLWEVDDDLWKADVAVMDAELVVEADTEAPREVDEVVLEVEAINEVLVEVPAVDRLWVIVDVAEVWEVDDVTDRVEVDAWKHNSSLLLDIWGSMVLTWMFEEAPVKSGAHVRHPATTKGAKGAALSQHQPNKPSPVPLTHVPKTHPTHSIIRYKEGKNLWLIIE